MLKLAGKKASALTCKKTKAKIGILEMDRQWYQSVKRFLCPSFEISAINFQDILFNNVDVGEYHSILVGCGIKYESIDISATLDLVTIIKKLSAKPPALLLITDCADSQITVQARSYLPQIDGVFAKDHDLALLLKVMKIIAKQKYFK
ncbi:sll1472 [Synechocystis sp. PCC 6803]|uniref:Sll1472 protein n=1 Tax=Synechocystis sp. (strain ATCC 27184 / PCC 6803 / Kazusa) TaxID=1111708 RepID=P74624_SYNY3|nr:MULTISPECIES: hypothetical protein [unclassified Synechocystis]BAM53401.1 hypothetical protein BEST7613_4470 [Synechocystis sp. PCC 6803] [Bacillus subtilis BEST7613]AGF53282.1 hypothetical protein MYO_130630 [Synechocystis sp. PCC 6803]ALJ69148.1 hypothetical protein AOY38_15705 [Synechocystis sp. PCC 6803]AVP91020.1 hypothetical protein C7I86_15865 [Synechocystis sp. IPPAS B-1465]MBD2618142.1 hypothetical protein [Synechocystis sp. FACHB-898]